MLENDNIRVSRQKIYNALIIIKAQYNSFNNLCVYASYTPYQGLRLYFKPDLYVRRTCWMSDTLELTDCLNKDNLFEIANSIGLEVELWIKQNKFKYDKVPDTYKLVLK